MKYQLIKMLVLSAIIGPLAYWAYTNSPTYNEWFGAPNFFHRVQHTVSVEAVGEEKAIAQAAKAEKPLYIRGKQVILSRDAAFWAKRDAEVVLRTKLKNSGLVRIVN